MSTYGVTHWKSLAKKIKESEGLNQADAEEEAKKRLKVGKYKEKVVSAPISAPVPISVPVSRSIKPIENVSTKSVEKLPNINKNAKNIIVQMMDMIQDLTDYAYRFRATELATLGKKKTLEGLEFLKMSNELDNLKLHLKQYEIYKALGCPSTTSLKLGTKVIETLSESSQIYNDAIKIIDQFNVILNAIFEESPDLLQNEPLIIESLKKQDITYKKIHLLTSQLKTIVNAMNKILGDTSACTFEKF
jgi:hypothetical protein